MGAAGRVEWEGNGGGGKEAEGEEKGLLDGVGSVLDFDMLCATVAMQTQGFSVEKRGKGGMVAVEEEEEEAGEVGGVQRMWEGGVLDCFQDHRIAIEATCLPCYRFGKNMGRANLGSCFLQITFDAGADLSLLRCRGPSGYWVDSEFWDRAYMFLGAVASDPAWLPPRGTQPTDATDHQATAALPTPLLLRPRRCSTLPHSLMGQSFPYEREVGPAPISSPTTAASLEPVSGIIPVVALWTKNPMHPPQQPELLLAGQHHHRTAVIFPRASLYAAWVLPGPLRSPGTVYFFFMVTILFNVIAFSISMQRCFLYLAVAFTILAAIYLGYFRGRIRKQFNIRGSNSALDDCLNHLLCPCCTLCQESRTLEMNYVQDGVWHGRGDTICIGSFGEGNKPFTELCPPSLIPTQSPELHNMGKAANNIQHSWSAETSHSTPLVPAN
ncbi:hypothetical protein Taro_024116 [Colocasia esculenta]|uniref:Uncharacterized protein n=1 Tax=Colocasia esculenta TaxID=4460 RepID=A0A843VDH9_COLES|nr:hypothetical protein [Colocasia esculenta]